MNLREMQERLLAWASAEARKPLLLEARREHFARHGEPHEEDKSFEPRMNALVDHFLYDFRPGGGPDAVLDLFMRDAGDSLTTDDRAAFRDLGRGIHGLFEVRRIRPGEVRLRDVFTRQDHDVIERRAKVGLEKGDLFEARLLPYQGRLYFSGAFLYHPRAVRKAILAEVKRLRKRAGKGGRPDVPAFLGRLSRMAFKLERYRNVMVGSIYDFSAPEPTPAPRAPED